MRKFSFPSAHTILLVLIVLVAGLTWVIPAGQYQMEINTTLNKAVPIAGTWHATTPQPQGLSDIVLAPGDGFYNHKTNEAGAIDVALFILVIGGFLGVVTKTGAIDAGIERVMLRLRGKEEWMIPILMAIFATGGTIYGMTEESLPFYSLMVPIMLTAGFDCVVAAAVVMLGAGIGTLGSTINPFATVIASNAAGISFTWGIGLRLAILLVGWLICVTWVMRYAIRIRRDPALSIVADLHQEHRTFFLRSHTDDRMLAFTPVRKTILLLFAIAFAIMIYGVAVRGWWMAQISGVFLVAAIVIGLIARMSEKELTHTFISGAQDLLGVALIIGIARGIVVVMDNGMITHTVLHAAEQIVTGLSSISFISVVFMLEGILSFLVPSSSGLAVLTMPILAPLADFSHIDRDLVVTAYQSASGLVNLITPTSAVVMGGLAIAHVPYLRWLKWVSPLLLILLVMLLAMIGAGAAL